MPLSTPTSRVAIAALFTGALVWGLIWYPYRALQSLGLSGAASAVLTYGVALIGAQLVFARALRQLRPSWMLVWIGLAAGGCNLGYVLAMLHGEVMRVLLLFYVAPLWTVLLSRMLLGEHLTPAGAGVIGLSVAGAVTMLWHPELGAPWPDNAAEWTGLASGFLFALSNVLIRKTPDQPIEVKSSAVFLGVVVIGAAAMPFSGGLPLAALLHADALVMLALLGGLLLVTNFVVQYGLTRTTANRAIVIFLSELVVAAASSWLLAGEAMGLKEWLGGAMIVGAGLFSARLSKSA